MTTNFDPDSIEEAIRGLQALGAAARTTGGLVQNAVESSVGESEKLDKKRKESYEKQAAAIQRVANNLLSLSNQFQQGGGSFTALNGVIDLTVKGLSSLAGILGPFSGIAKGFLEAGGEVAKELTKNFDRAYTIFEQLSEVGTVQSFLDLNEILERTGMNYGDSAKTLTKFSKELSNFGGSAVAGRKEFEQISSESRLMRQDFQKLGIGVADFNDMQLTYISQQTNWGLRQGKQTKDLADGTKIYIQELDQLSKITGLNRKDIQAQRDAAMSETRFAAALAQLPESVQKSANDLNIIIQKSAPDLAQGFRDMMSGSVTTDAAKQLVQQTGGVAGDIIAQFRAGAIDQFEADRRLRASLKQTIGPMGQLGQYIGDAALYTKSFAQNRNYANRAELTPEEVKKLSDEQRKNLKETEGQNAELAKAKQSLYNTGVTLEKLWTASDTATWAISKMASGVDFLTEKLYELAGKEIPADVKARLKLNEVLDDERKARSTLIDQEKEVDKLKKEKHKLDTYVPPADETKTDKNIRERRIQDLQNQIISSEKSLVELRKQHEGKKDKVAEARKTADEETAKIRLEDTKKTGVGQNQNLGSGTTGLDKKYSGLRIKSAESVGGIKKVPAEQQKEAIANEDKVIELMKKFSKEFPGTTIAAFNDLYHWDPENKTETSKHKLGKAVDFTMDPGPATAEDSDRIVAYLKSIGFNDVKDAYHRQKHGTGPHFHAELMAAGGVTRGISIAGEAGPEAVVPLPDGRTIPVEIRNQARTLTLDGKTIPVEIQNKSLPQFSDPMRVNVINDYNNFADIKSISSDISELIQKFSTEVIPVEIRNQSQQQRVTLDDKTIPVEIRNQSQQQRVTLDDKTIPVEIKNNYLPAFADSMPVEIRNQQYMSSVKNLDNFEIANLAEIFKNSISELKQSQEAANNKLLELIAQSKINNDHARAMSDILNSTKNIQRNMLSNMA